MDQARIQPYYVGGSSSDHNVVLQSTTTPLTSNSNESSAIRRFVELTGMLSAGEPAMSFSEICAFVRGCLNP